MRIIAAKTISRFIASREEKPDYKAVKKDLDAWMALAKDATWSTPMELKAQLGAASIVGERVVFNIKGNDYRLVVAINYQRQTIFVKWFGTHEEYDKINVRTVEYGD